MIVWPAALNVAGLGTLVKVIDGAGPAARAAPVPAIISSADIIAAADPAARPPALPQKPINAMSVTPYKHT